MSDSEHSTVTYTSLSEDDLYMGSPGVEVPIYEGPPSPDYVPGPEEPEQAPPSPIYIPFVPEPVYPEFLPVDDEVFPAEEQPLPAADSPTHQSPGYIPESDPEEDLEEDDEEDPEEDPANYPLDQSATPFSLRKVLTRVFAYLRTPSPLSPFHHLLRIPSPPLPIPPPPPIIPTYAEESLGSRAAGIRRRDALPSPIHDTGGLLVMWLPLRKRLCRTTPGPGYEVGESSAAGTARRVDYQQLGDYTDLLIHRGPLRTPDLPRRMSIIYSQLVDAAVLMEEEARLSRAAWAQSMDVCDQTHSEGILLRTTVMTQQSEIVELRAADQRRQTVISELLKADYRRQRQLVETLKIVKSLKAQMIEIQRQQGPAKDPAEPELPEEAGSST
ncbi:hypothetical protein Tco_0728731 [Tanacetum coccineum]|uniref:Uncharacterized protein n=1 Tax=Tanacetum coccineum TaxID=301880 RepID=A0ABQ4YPF0_9ASTR